MARYFKRQWDESRGDQYDHWGTSVWYFQIDVDRFAERQLEIYISGNVLAYNREHHHDEYGGLGDQPFDEEEWNAFEITADEFERAWKQARPRNQSNG